MKSRVICRVAVLMTLACTATLAAPAAHAYAADLSPGALCVASNAAVLEASLSPFNNATVPAGVPVTFSAQSQSPVSFAVASSPALLPSPDVDAGLGTAQPQPASVGPPAVYAYRFSSSKTTAKEATVYWQASFSSADLAACAGQPARTYRTGVRKLTVKVGAPSPSVAPPFVIGPLRPRVSIAARGRFRLAHPTVAYRVRCPTSCSGQTAYRVLVLGRHGVRRARKLDFGPRRVSIASASGGVQLFAHRYAGGALRRLRGMLRSGAVVEVQISVKVRDASGTLQQARSALRLRR